MSEHRGVDIDLRDLTLDDIAELRGAFEGLATQYRRDGRPAMESFVLSLASMAHSTIQQISARTGQPMPTAAATPAADASGIDLSHLDAAQSIAAANTAFGIAQGFEKQAAADPRFSALADTFLGIAQVFGRRTKALVDASEDGSGKKHSVQ